MTIWEQLDTLSDAELRTLVAIAVEVLAESHAEPDIPEDVAMIANATAAREAAKALRPVDTSVTADDIRRALGDPHLSREMALTALRVIGQTEIVVSEIVSRYEEQKRQLAAPELILLTGALLVLATKLKKVQITSRTGPASDDRSIVVEFAGAAEAVKAAIAALLKIARGG